MDDELRWAPWLCRIPRAATARFSESDDPETHGHKLYTLYAMDPVAYGAQPTQGFGLGVDPASTRIPGFRQVIVKASFASVLLDDALAAELGSAPNEGVGVHGLQPAERDGGRFVAGERRGLYLMLEPEAAVEGTDAGWVYATVEADGSTVTAMGVIESCAGCHAEAGEGRLFGLPGLAAKPAAPSPSLRKDANVMPR